MPRRRAQQALERRHRDRLAGAAARERRVALIDRIRVMGVGVEAGARSIHPPDEVRRGDAARARRAEPSRRPRRVAAGLTDLMPAIARVEDPRDVGLRRGGIQPDSPCSARSRSPSARRIGSARASCLREAAKKSSPLDGAMFGPRSPFAQSGVPQIVTTRIEPARVERAQETVRPAPAELSWRRLDAIPVERDANDVEARADRARRRARRGFPDRTRATRRPGFRTGRDSRPLPAPAKSASARTEAAVTVRSTDLMCPYYPKT